jgi:hypothetical protein
MPLQPSRIRSTRSLLLLFALLAFAPLGDLQAQAAPGDTLRVDERSGRETEGVLLRHDSSSVTLRLLNGADTLSLAAGDVIAAEMRGGTYSGGWRAFRHTMAIGIGVTAATMVVMAESPHGTDGGPAVMVAAMASAAGVLATSIVALIRATTIHRVWCPLDPRTLAVSGACH